jgi:predicted lipoprotein with Yx(FWY)xxD motif
VKVAPSQLLVTAKGLALYVFAPDKPNVSTCYAVCAKYWPPLLVSATAKVPATMPGIPGKFGTTMRKDGTRQLTYDGAPLYTFIKDKDSGDMYGQGVVAGGGYWWAVVAARGMSSGSSS